MDIEFVTMLNNFWQRFLKILPSLSISIIVLIIFLLLGNNVSNFFRKRLYAKSNDILLSNFLGKISKWVFMIVGFVISMEVLGLATVASGIIAGAGISAIVIGLAFKNIGENFLSGLLLAFNRPFNVGDLIETSGYTGTITSLDFRTTNIKTENGQNVFIPNSLILNNPLKNISREGLRRFDFIIQIDYNNDIQKAKDLILSAVNDVKEVLKDPAPAVVVDQLTTVVNVKTYFWIDALKADRSIMIVKGDVVEKSSYNLTKGGILISDLTQIKITNEEIPIRVNYD
ncbi:MAG: mechanosensitive ion channel family protein [Bacteroidota bacterium]|nr:mechanosensitive ion channel family protein [Bacteroidota bacterium]